MTARLRWWLLSIPFVAEAQELGQRLAVLVPDQWLSYEVPLQADMRAPCCFEAEGKQASDGACHLGRSEWNLGHRQDGSHAWQRPTVATHRLGAGAKLR